LQTTLQNPRSDVLPRESLNKENFVEKRSCAAQHRLLSIPSEPLFIADWVQVLMIHFEVTPFALQVGVPFALDLHEGKAFVSVVAFTMRGMRLRFGGRFAAALLKPISTHHFLNVRTYVRHNGEPGIYFMREWVSNRLSVALGPHAFGLPYRFAKIHYSSESSGNFTGTVEEGREGKRVTFRAEWNSAEAFDFCKEGSICDWLMERYTAYTSRREKKRFFRVCHWPWMKIDAEVLVEDQSLLENNWQFFREARLVDAYYSPGVFDVWMGWPHKIKS